MNENIKHLPKSLKSLVNEFISIFGEVIKEEAGAKSFRLIDNIRKDMVLYRKSSNEARRELLNKLYLTLEKKNKNQRNEIAHAFSLSLEIINACEAAYRTFRLKESGSFKGFKKQNNSLIWVLTAHPTEARTTQNIELFHRIQNIAVRLLEKQEEKEYLLSIVKHNLKLAWMLPITRHTKPKVIDEASHIYSILFRPDIINTILRADRDLAKIRVRTWVGGDKDGHPGVDQKVMVGCLQESRFHFLNVIISLIKLLEKDLDFINSKKLFNELKNIKISLKDLKKVEGSDAVRIEKFKTQLNKFNDTYLDIVGDKSPRVRKIFSLLDLFPGLVIPLELREDSETIEQALKSKTPLAISRMIRTVSHIARGGDLKNYAQGMIISMCESFTDISNTLTLVKSNIDNKQKLTIPIVPLFETSDALKNSQSIVELALRDKTFLSHIAQDWDNKFEIMFGYSDSSKGMGVFASRLGIAKTMRSLDLIIRKKNITPIFFHGSGGSVDRGGGSLQEQTAWWPRSALDFYKATIQGEMVERQFSSPEILLSNVQKILSRYSSGSFKEGEVKVTKVIEQFAISVSEYYRKEISDPDFFKMVELATPYSYLNVLKLGSRPSKRSGSGSIDFNSIRAIPWVLCWTQTRTLFPTWWGVGSSWVSIKNRENEVTEIKKAYSQSNIFASFIRILGFTLSKVDLEVFYLYLQKSSLTHEQIEHTYKKFKSEYLKSCNFVLSITGEKNLIWFRPWLRESIMLRSAMIHPLNVLQIIGYLSKDVDLVRKTTAGISSGMLTTG